MGIIDEIKQKTDIVEVIGQYTKLTKAGKTFRALCPFHSENHGSFFVYPEQQSWHCFGACGTGGDVFSFIMKKDGVEFGEALRILADRAGVVVPSRSELDIKKDEKEKLYRINETAAQYFNNLLLNSAAGEKAKNYILERGLSQKTITDFQLGYSLNNWETLKQYLAGKGYSEKEMLEAGLIIAADDGKTHDRFRNRLMFPIWESRGRVTGFGARALDDSMPKYLNSPQTPVFDKSGTLYGINFAASGIRKQDRAVLVEGYMDVIMAHQYEFTNVIASMGTSVTDKQINTLKKLSKNMVLALDSDSAGEEAMLRCVGYENTLEAELKVVIAPPGKDPDEIIKEDKAVWQKLVDEAVPVVDYTINMVTAGLDLDTAKDKTQATGKLMPIIAEIKDPVRQGHYLQKIARMVKVSERSLEPALRKNSTVKNTKTGKEQKQTAARVLQSLLSSPIEEDCISLLLKHPEFKSKCADLLPEYFGDTQNREIFLAWQKIEDINSLKESLNPALNEHLDALLAKNLRSSQIEERYKGYALRLREEYYRGLERKRAAALTLEAMEGGTAAELAKLEEQGLKASIGLRDVFSQKARKGMEQRR